MVLSWSLTEVVRYSFYAFSLLGREPRPLVFLRYTLFYLLYPTGASSEAFLIFATLPPPAFGWLRGAGDFADLHARVREFLFAVWWPGECERDARVRRVLTLVAGLYVMYTHMIKQRRKVFGGAKTKTA